jgi:tetratricopeptide (TPR) repeat protein
MRFATVFLILVSSIFSTVLFSCQGEKKTGGDKDLKSFEENVQYISPLGTIFYPTKKGSTGYAKADSLLHIAMANFDADPSEENYIWLGRRLAYLNRYLEAIEIFSEGIIKFPDSYRLYRHRGHRYISLRMLDYAISDFTVAAQYMQGQPIEIEEDGLPNKLGIPLSSTQFNVWYHLGLANYLNGDYTLAMEAYEKCMEVSNNDDLICATADWMYMTAIRAGDLSTAKKALDKIHDDMNIIENDSYYLRLRMYQGKVNEEELMPNDPEQIDALSIATQGYGLGNWQLIQGDTAKAIVIFEKVLEGTSWSAFGYIASEVDYLRLTQ